MVSIKNPTQKVGFFVIYEFFVILIERCIFSRETMAEITEFNVGQGETWKVLLTVINDDTGAPLDIVSQSFEGVLRENYSTDDVAASFLIQKLQPYTCGSLFLSLSDTETEALSQRKYVYDLKMTSGSIVRRILEGYFVVRPAATR